MHDCAKDLKALRSWKIDKTMLHMGQAQRDGKVFLEVQMWAID